ncbi:hypothetical protein COOONC_01819 [Cooperia oncophora]
MDSYFQEPASFVFSLLNFCSFYLLYVRLKLVHELNKRSFWILYTITGLVTWYVDLSLPFLFWICSAIFHARDCWLTEYMDYFSAFAFILCASYVSFCFTQSWLGTSAYRTWWMYVSLKFKRPSRRHPFLNFRSTIYGSSLFLWFARHVYHMTHEVELVEVALLQKSSTVFDSALFQRIVAVPR